MSSLMGMKDDQLVQFKLMLPAALKARLDSNAALNRRSLSQEIVYALEERYPAPTPERATDPAARLLLFLARKIRGRNPAVGSFRDKQATIYEGLARDLADRVRHIADDNPSQKDN